MEASSTTTVAFAACGGRCITRSPRGRQRRETDLRCAGRSRGRERRVEVTPAPHLDQLPQTQERWCWGEGNLHQSPRVGREMAATRSNKRLAVLVQRRGCRTQPVRSPSRSPPTASGCCRDVFGILRHLRMQHELQGRGFPWARFTQFRGLGNEPGTVRIQWGSLGNGLAETAEREHGPE